MKRYLEPSARQLFLLGFVACFSLLAIAAYFQFVEKLEPCPLCISQRLMILSVGVLFLAAAIHNPKRIALTIYTAASIICATIGAGISLRHLWIQNLSADKIPECGPGLGYVFANFPLLDTIKLMLSGTGDCADVVWVFLGLSIPGWTLVSFLGLGILSILAAKRSVAAMRF